ncbi:MAG TPA: hypothetical protein VHP38_06420 [Ruminiclostridium sp.]|nr:hypothetical protein [Ruminiclostridium sp.]
MTAEIGILNRTAVALAADSASTLKVAGKTKFTTADKLFDLSKHVGMMVYDNAYFTGVPWEVVIKIYRLSIKSVYYETLREYSDSFLKFLTNETEIYDQTYENELVVSALKYCLNEAGIQDSPAEKNDSLNKQLEEKVKDFSQIKFLDGFDESFVKSFVEKYHLPLQKYMGDISPKAKQNLILLCAYVISKTTYLTDTMPSSGIVIAGYGSKEIFPSLYEYKITGIVNGKLIYQIKRSVKIHEASNIPTNIFSTIMPFAQTDIVETYTLGIDTEIKNTIFNEINRIFDNFYDIITSEAGNALEHEFSGKDIDAINTVGLKLKKKITDAFTGKQTAKYIDPLMYMAGFLGTEEMASLAEALVNLTSIRRRYTTDEETVGGAAHVAVITKGEGFVWKL